jgi:AcrR family transcriptional regulator
MSASSASSDPQRRAYAIRSRQLVLNAAKALLGDRGATITVEAISKKAGVTEATVVRTFGSKEALIDTAIAELIEPLIQLGHGSSCETNPKDALKRFVFELIQFYVDHHIKDDRLAGLDLPLAAARRESLCDALSSTVIRVRDYGVLRTDIDPIIIAKILDETAYSIAASKTPSHELLESYVTIVLDGIEYRSSS